MFHKILIANRGEIALRIIRACREMGIRTVIAHSTADAASRPVRLADESVCIGPPEARASYLNIPSIISAAAITDSEAIHPGYGLLSENPAFAEICRACGITFIGPSPEAIRLMGDKAQAREMAKHAGAPVVPGSEGPLGGVDEAQGLADSIGYPVMVKAAAGGGGRGMRAVDGPDAMGEAFERCRSEAEAAFGDGALFVERLVERPRHVVVGAEDVEVAFDAVPGRVFKGKVRLILDAIATGQLQPTGTLVDYEAVTSGGRALAVIDFEDKLDGYQIPLGAAAQVAIYTEHWEHLSLLRKILLRMRSWENYLFLEGH